jgi:two-component system response regulator HydG
MAYAWPGNVRELRNAVDYMVIFDVDGILDEDDLPDELAGERIALPAPTGGDGPGLTALVGKPLSEMEKLFIAETLKMTGGNREEAAKMLGIGERTLYRKIKEFDL